MDLPETRYEDEREPLVEEASRCHAILASGDRCPNPAEEGRRYCAVPQHRELANRDTDRVVPTAGEEAAEAERGGDLDDEQVVELEEGAAGAEAAAIGGTPESDPTALAEEDPALRAVVEGDESAQPGDEELDRFVAGEDRPEDADLTPDAQDVEAPGRRLADEGQMEP